MNRREALKGVALLTGGALSPSVVSAILSGITAGGSGKWSPKIVTGRQNELITTVAELIIPATDTPGAKAAKVNEFIDLMLAEWLSSDEKDSFFRGVEELDRRDEKLYSAKFVECSVEEQTAILKKLEAEAASQKGDDGGPKPFFSQMKELVLIGYFTSEIGVTQELKHFVATDRYEGCIPFEKIGRAWSE